jgi:ABC-2 type transport system permease protein
VPVLAGVLYSVGDPTTSSREFADDITASLVASAILPLVVLLLGTSAFGSEVNDRTLGYLVLKPLPRWRIVAPKLLATLVVGGLPVAASAVVAVALIGVDAGGAVATGLGVLAGAAAYAAIFTFAGLATRHAVVGGLVYVFVWEASLASYLDGVRLLSVRQYTLGLVAALDPDRLETIDVSVGGGTATAAAAAVVVGFAALAVRRLSRMDVP